MHMTKLLGIDIEVAEQVKTDSTFVPPLPATPPVIIIISARDELISPDDIDVEYL